MAEPQLRAQYPWDTPIDQTEPITNPLQAVARFITWLSVPRGGGVSEGIAPLAKTIPPRGLAMSGPRKPYVGNNAPISKFSPEDTALMHRDITRGRRDMIMNQKFPSNDMLEALSAQDMPTPLYQRMWRQKYGEDGALSHQTMLNKMIEDHMTAILGKRAPTQGRGPTASHPDMFSTIHGQGESANPGYRLTPAQERRFVNLLLRRPPVVE